MNKSLSPSPNRAVAWWLLTGAAMIMIQVLIGGITRLTESGLSITEWKPITGMLPPLSNGAWQIEFDKYKQTDQFKYLHADFTLSDFKFIFFWEWFHRFWARLLGIVFIIGFVWFLIKRKFKREMIIPLIILFLLGALQGAIGWIMVKSGLVPEKYFVGHVELTTHFMAALGLLVYTFWFALRLLVPEQQRIHNPALKNFTIAILLVLFVQLCYGGFMAGLRAATAAPTWPTINGEWVPDAVFKDMGDAGLVNHPIVVHFIHRALAYLVLLLVTLWFFILPKTKISAWLNKTKIWPLALVWTQVILGICTVLFSPSSVALVWFGVLHQFTAMLLLISLVWMRYLIKK
ncbi:MAG: COX15/CtaA family protein [Chitinophagaceae bacterium]|nr:COX15/CtaA family protein [Chitinophagaceae bacterium]